jgi:hypothetical protein
MTVYAPDSAIKIKEYPESKMMSQTFQKVAAKKIEHPKRPKVIVNTLKESVFEVEKRLKTQ